MGRLELAVTTSLLNLDIVDPEHGGFKVILMPNGNLLVRALPYGLMENVSISYLYSFTKLKFSF
jgi:hypothetical protein